MRQAFGAIGLLLAASSLVLARTEIRTEGLAQGDQSAQSFRMSLEFDPVDIEEIVVNSEVYTLFHMDEAGMLGRSGHPDLPLVNRLIEMPDRAAVAVERVGGEFTIIDNVLPLPMQETMHHAEDQPQPWYQDEDLYQLDAWYPDFEVLLGDPVLLRNHRLCKASVSPIQVNLATGQARIWTSMELDVRFEGENPINMREYQLPAQHTRLEGRVAEAVVNPIRRDGELNGAWIDPGKMPGKYLVFASSTALNNSSTGLPALLDWKRQRGHTVVVESSNLNSSTSIKNRILAEYNSDEPVKFVLLVGDTDGTYAVASDGTNGYDHFYSRVEGTDILADVAVGRISVDNLTQMATVCNKILQYERNPYNSNPSWFNHASFLVGSSACYLSMRQVSRNIGHELVDSRGYTDIDTVWCQNSGAVAGFFNSGITFYNYRGWIGMEGLNQGTVQGWTQGPRTPVATIFTCSTGDFVGGDDYTEAFLRGGNPTTPGAAVACMGYATASTHTRYNNVMCGGFYHAFLEEDVPEVGSCLAHSKYELFMTLPPGDFHVTDFSNWGNLMGDPGMRMWAGTPRTVETTIPGSIRRGAGFLQLDLTIDDAAAEGIIVSAWQDLGDDDYFQSTTMSDEDGHVWLDMQGIESGSLTLTISHHRAYPEQYIITVSEAGNNPVVSNWSVDGQATVFPGSVDQALSLNIMNDGGSDLSGISLTASLAPAFGTVSSNTVNVADINQGATSGAITGLTLTPASNLHDGESLPLILEMNSDQGTVEMLATLTVGTPDLQLSNQSYPMGTWQPATARSIRLNLQNGGSFNGTDISVELVSDQEDFVVVQSAAQTSADLSPGQNSNFDFSVDITQDALVGMTLQLHANVSMASGDVAHRIDLLVPVGNPSSGDPTGPDAWGYWAYEDDDNTYAQAPTFDWIGIAPAEGGAGTLVPLTDNGDEQDDAVRMNLPFTFAYYGVYYDEVSVCSNGFISFSEPGAFAETDFRNHYMPSGMGPDAMIAPMWDDHKTTPGDVYTWFDADQHIFVVEWYNLSANQSGGPNTFQVILYDQSIYPTGTGDGEFKFQYQTWNDNQSTGSDFPNCSVGMKDHTSTIGMTLKNYGQLNPTMHSIGSGTAVLFTTTVNGVLTPAEISVDMAGLEVGVPAGSGIVDSLEIANLGEVTMLWNAWLTFDSRDSGGPDSYGYEWLDSEENLGPNYDWVEQGDAAVPVTFTHNDTTSGWFDVGFDFYLYGQSFNQFRISPNGFLSFSSWSGAWSNQELPSELAPQNSVCVWWDDLRPVDNAEGYCWYETNGTDMLVVSWTSVPHYNPATHGGPFTMQAILRANGQITLQYESLGSGHSGTAGLQGELSGTGMTVFHNQTVETPYAVRITPPAWVVLPVSSGIVLGGNSTWVPMVFNSSAGYQLPEGEYNATLHISSNDPNNSEAAVPIVMNVGTVSVESPGVLPTQTRLKANVPNPFNPTTLVRFDVAISERVTINVYNMLGQQVAQLLDNQQLAAGSHSMEWDASHLSSGIYLLEMLTPTSRDQSKLMLMK